jgi:hypothetical protein
MDILSAVSGLVFQLLDLLTTLATLWQVPWWLWLAIGLAVYALHSALF